MLPAGRHSGDSSEPGSQATPPEALTERGAGHQVVIPRLACTDFACACVWNHSLSRIRYLMNSIPAVAGTGTSGDEPEPFIANTLSASLTVNVIETSLAWYRDVLGFTVAQTHERDGKMFAVSLRAGPVAILLTQDNGARGSDRVKGAGMSLRLTTSQNIDELATRVRERGGILETEPGDMRGVRVFRLVDPDGFKLVISSEPA